MKLLIEFDCSISDDDINGFIELLEANPAIKNIEKITDCKECIKACNNKDK